MQKIDAHHHFWKYSPVAHSWITEELQILKRDYLPEDLETEIKKSGYTGVVSVQASQTEAETDFLLGLAEQNEFIKGVVGWLDLQAENIEDRLAHYTQHPKFKGIRHIVQDEPDDQFLLRKDFLRGIEKLKNFDLTYDILIFPKHLKVALEFVQKFPEHKFVINHLAKPFIKNQKIQPWKDEITELAKYENVYCKLSGMVTEASWENWKPEDFKPYLDVAFEAFGSKRLMTGSDWPVCRLAGEYGEVMPIVEEYLPDEASKKAVLAQNAIDFYSL
ncbi:amidohydrolase family protein [Rapidithrix thailandica]|uniref:Amidohydrolase family protein n=1 Tax=Rapidithrix thailandica TaxID=413964 RepID=A0AAW9SC70_9BACT